MTGNMTANADAIIHTLRRLCVRDKYAIYRALRSDSGVMAFAADRRERKTPRRTAARRPGELDALTAEDFLKMKLR